MVQLILRLFSIFRTFFRKRQRKVEPRLKLIYIKWALVFQKKKTLSVEHKWYRYKDVLRAILTAQTSICLSWYGYKLTLLSQAFRVDCKSTLYKRRSNIDFRTSNDLRSQSLNVESFHPCCLTIVKQGWMLFMSLWASDHSLE